MIDHHKRADRLREFMENLSKLNEDCLADTGITLDGEIPHVPARFAESEWDGSGSFINFFDTIEDANAGAGDLGGEYPWVPSTMLDLDTGVAYEPMVTVRFKPLRWVVKVSFGATRTYDMRFPTKRAVHEYLRAQKANGGVTVLEGPTDTLREAANG